MNKRGGETYHRWGGPKPFWGGVLWYVFPSPEFSTPLSLSLTRHLGRCQRSVCGIDPPQNVRNVIVRPPGGRVQGMNLDRQNCTIVTASDFRVERAESPEFPLQKWVCARNSQLSKSQRSRFSIAPLNRSAALPCLVSEIAKVIAGVRDGHRNRMSQQALWFRCWAQGWGLQNGGLTVATKVLAPI